MRPKSGSCSEQRDDDSYPVLRRLDRISAETATLWKILKRLIGPCRTPTAINSKRSPPATGLNDNSRRINKNV